MTIADTGLRASASEEGEADGAPQTAEGASDGAPAAEADASATDKTDSSEADASAADKTVSSEAAHPHESSSSSLGAAEDARRAGHLWHQLRCYIRD